MRLAFLGAFAAMNLLALFTLRFENSMANWWLTPVVAVGYVVGGVRWRAGSVERPEASTPVA